MREPARAERIRNGLTSRPTRMIATSTRTTSAAMGSSGAIFDQTSCMGFGGKSAGPGLAVQIPAMRRRVLALDAEALGAGVDGNEGIDGWGREGTLRKDRSGGGEERLSGRDHHRGDDLLQEVSDVGRGASGDDQGELQENVAEAGRQLKVQVVALKVHFIRHRSLLRR